VSREALQKLADAGMTAPNCQACYEGSEDWKPLSAFIRPTAKPEATTTTPSATQTPSNANTSRSASQPPQLQSSSLVVVFRFFAVLDFIAGAWGILMVLNGANSTESFTGIVLFASGVGGGFLLLGFAKVIECLHEMVFRLRNLERLAAHPQSNSGQ